MNGLWILLLASFMGLSMRSAGTVDAEITIESRIDKNAVKVLEPFELTVMVACPAGYQVDFPTQSEITSRLGPLGLTLLEYRISQGQINQETDAAADQVWHELRLQMDSMEVGALEIPAFEVLVTNTTGESQVLRSTLQNILVETVLEPTTTPDRPKDIANVIDAEASQSRTLGRWVIGLALLGISALGTTAYVYMKRRRRGMSEVVWLTKQLDRLENDVRGGESDPSSAIADATFAIKEYLGMRFKLSGVFATNQEITSECIQAGCLEDEDLHLLTRVLQRAEATQYAVADLKAEEIVQLLDEIRAWLASVESRVDRENHRADSAHANVHGTDQGIGS